MRPLSTNARGLLAASAEVARFRGATDCSWRDVVIAWLAIHGGSDHPSLYADQEASSSPDMLPFSPELQTLLTVEGDEINRTELIGAAVSACRELLAELDSL